MVRLVHPAPAGQPTDPPARRRGRSASLSLTPDERRHLAASLRNLRWAFGTWGALALVMGVPAITLVHAASVRTPGKGSGILAIRAAKAGGMTVETVLGGTLNAAGRCKACGSRIGDRPALAVGGAS